MNPQLRPVQAALSRQVVIHPGVSRTATSTLQRRVFSRCRRISYLGVPAPTPDLDWAIAHLCQADTIYLDPDRLHDAFRRAIDQMPRDACLVMSYENFVNHKSKDKGIVAQRLHDLFPQARILFTIRQQEDRLVSTYLTDARKRVVDARLLDFDDWFWQEWREPHRAIFDDLHYFEIIDYYRRLFDASRIAVLLYEELRDDPREYGRKLAATIGIEPDEIWRLLQGPRENVAMSRRYFRFWRYVGPLLPRPVARRLARSMNRHQGQRMQIPLSAEIKAHVAALYADGNARLTCSHGVDLARFGYSLPGSCSAMVPCTGADTLLGRAVPS